jgi:hypothetical protein
MLAMTDVTVNEGGDPAAGAAAGMAGVAAGQALEGAGAAQGAAANAQAAADAATATAAAAQRDAEEARIMALSAQDATAELARLQLLREMRRDPPTAPTAAGDPPLAAGGPPAPAAPPPAGAPAGDQLPPSVKKQVKRKTLRERWEGGGGT